MTRDQFKTDWRIARIRRHSGGQSFGGLYLQPGSGAMREQIEPRRTYWAVLSQNMDRIARYGETASNADRLFYVKRARAMRKAKFRDNWAGC